MLNLKKTAVAVLALGSSAVFAGTMGPVCTPGNVTVPCERTAVDVGVYALYLQPVHSNSWGYISGPSAGAVQNYNHDWDWGFRLEGSYHFNTGNDVTVAWDRIDNERNGLFLVPSSDGRTNFNVDNEWDNVTVEFAQNSDFSANKKIRFHGGLQFAHIEHTRNNFTAANVLVNGDFSRFQGAGVRTGIDYTYVFGNGFGMFANGAAGLLTGTSKFRSGIVAGNPAAELNGSRDAIVPELDAKIGAKYTYAMASGDLNLVVDYRWINYFDALHNNFDSSFGLPGAGILDSNFALSGVEFGANYVWNM